MKGRVTSFGGLSWNAFLSLKEKDLLTKEDVNSFLAIVGIDATSRILGYITKSLGGDRLLFYNFHTDCMNIPKDFTLEDFILKKFTLTETMRVGAAGIKAAEKAFEILFQLPQSNFIKEKLAQNQNQIRVFVVGSILIISIMGIYFYSRLPEKAILREEENDDEKLNRNKSPKKEVEVLVDAFGFQEVCYDENEEASSISEKSIVTPGLSSSSYSRAVFSHTTTAASTSATTSKPTTPGLTL